MSSTSFLQGRFRWSEWYGRSHILRFHRNKKEMRSIGITFAIIEGRTKGALSNSKDAMKVGAKIRGCFQREAYKLIKLKHQPNFENRIRSKTERWQLSGPPAHVAARIARHLQSLPSLVAPSVQAVCLSTLWNRRCTLVDFSVATAMPTFAYWDARVTQKTRSSTTSCVARCGVPRRIS